MFQLIKLGIHLSRRVDESFQGKQPTDFVLEHCTIQLHDVERQLWTGAAKGDLILYYNQIAGFILPHIKGRPQSLNLKLTHAGGPTTFIKDMEHRQPDCASVFTDKRRVAEEGRRNRIDYLVCNNLKTLLFIVDCGCIDINTWGSRADAPESPDYIWLDLDPPLTRLIRILRARDLKRPSKWPSRQRKYSKATSWIRS